MNFAYVNIGISDRYLNTNNTNYLKFKHVEIRLYTQFRIAAYHINRIVNLENHYYHLLDEVYVQTR